MGPNPAEQLEGLVLDDGWEVLERVRPRPGATGGNFSHGYIVRSPDGERAYLKALDYSRAFETPDPAWTLQMMTEAFNFERRLCQTCREKRLNRVVNALADGKTYIDPERPATVVQYLIFELAEGDVRSRLDSFDRFDVAFTLRCLHHIATGLKQLHWHGIAHQDLKPSNVLVFPDNVSKVGDLGRAVLKSRPSVHDDREVAGDTGYAPPELLYGFADANWDKRRIGCDVYLLGSMVAFFFAKSGMTALVCSFLDPDHRWNVWGGSYEDVLPYVRHAFGRAVDAVLRDVPADLKQDLGILLRELCEPDPRQRGNTGPKSIGHQQFALARYISRFNLLAKKAECGLIGR